LFLFRADKNDLLAIVAPAITSDARRISEDFLCFTPVKAHFVQGIGLIICSSAYEGDGTFLGAESNLTRTCRTIKCSTLSVLIVQHIKVCLAVGIFLFRVGRYTYGISYMAAGFVNNAANHSFGLRYMLGRYLRLNSHAEDSQGR